jgi:hypothetical protein
MTIVDERGRPIEFDPLTGETRIIPPPYKNDCDHGVTFDEEAARGLDEYEVQRRWPRLHGVCPRGCGYVGIHYASPMHYIMGDW